MNRFFIADPPVLRNEDRAAAPEAEQDNMKQAGKKLGMDIDGGQRGVAERPDHQRVEQVDGCRGRRLNHDRIGDPPKGGYILSCFGAEARR